MNFEGILPAGLLSGYVMAGKESLRRSLHFMGNSNRLIDNLNDMQQQAVLHNTGPLLILAGAGSGKTRVLTHRIAYLTEERGVSPYQIIALTCTNKAAGEMKERVASIVGEGAESIWVSTFHSSCVRILRRFIDTIGYDRQFTIYDSDDSKSLMKEVLKFLNIDTKQIKEKAVLSVISHAKDELIGPEEFRTMLRRISEASESQ